MAADNAVGNGDMERIPDDEFREQAEGTSVAVRTLETCAAQPTPHDPGRPAPARTPTSSTASVLTPSQASGDDS